MNNNIATVSFFIALLMLSACSAISPEAQSLQYEAQEKTQLMRLVSSGKPAEVLPAFSSFTWNDEYTSLLSAVNNSEADKVKAHIRTEIIRHLKTKGYQYQADPMRADVVIGFLFALEDNAGDNRIKEKFGLVPSVNNNALYKKGTFLLTVLDTQLTKVYWRAALQGFVDLEKGMNAPATDPMQAVLQLMMGDFPEAGR